MDKIERRARVIAAHKMRLDNYGEKLPDDLWTQCIDLAKIELKAEESGVVIPKGDPIWPEDVGVGIHNHPEDRNPEHKLSMTIKGLSSLLRSGVPGLYCRELEDFLILSIKESDDDERYDYHDIQDRDDGKILRNIRTGLFKWTSTARVPLLVKPDKMKCLIFPP